MRPSTHLPVQFHHHRREPNVDDQTASARGPSPRLALLRGGPRQKATPGWKETDTSQTDKVWPSATTGTKADATCATRGLTSRSVATNATYAWILIHRRPTTAWSSSAPTPVPHAGEAGDAVATAGETFHPPSAVAGRHWGHTITAGSSTRCMYH